jgi:hypothetical protein
LNPVRNRSKIFLWSLVPAALVLFGGLSYLLNVFGIYRYNLFIYAMLLTLVAAIYALSVGIALAWRRLRR